MLDLTSEMRWWEEWQLRILVLQFVLFVGSFLRHARSLKSTMWLAYLSSDALTTLFNRHKQPAGSDAASTVQLEVLWAPVLVRHLGGLHSSVLRHLTEGWNEFIVDATSYKRFNNLRGQWVMRRHQVRDQRLLWSLQVPFDLSVLIWHVATELCFHHPKSLPWPYTARRCSKVISDYMIYLLLIRPEMLLPGTRPGLFTIAGNGIEIMLECDREPPSRDERTTAQRILRAARHPAWYADQIGPWIPKACKLAEDLVEP